MLGPGLTHTCPGAGIGLRTGVVGTVGASTVAPNPPESPHAGQCDGQGTAANLSCPQQEPDPHRTGGGCPAPCQHLHGSSLQHRLSLSSDTSCRPGEARGQEVAGPHGVHVTVTGHGSSLDA